MRCVRHTTLIFAMALLAGVLQVAPLQAAPPQAAPLSRARALQALGRPDAAQRLAAVDRLAGIGIGPDADRVAVLLADADPQVREAAAAAMWLIWSRSGDAAIDARFVRGVGQMQAGALDDALLTFNEIVRRKPAFAEGWNKRATILFMMGRNDESLRDCDEVFKRNQLHFGALSGAGQIHMRLGNWQQALEFFQRALQVNPNLVGLEQVILMLERRLRDKARQAV